MSGRACHTLPTGRSRGRALLRPLAVAAAAILLAQFFQRAGLLDMPMLPGCGGDIASLQAGFVEALRMAAVMTLIGLVVPRPTLLTSAAGLRHLGFWILGLTLFSFADGQAAMAAMGQPAPLATLLLSYGPLAAALALIPWAPKGERCCIGFMLLMAHFGLMTWPWMALCALLGMLREGGVRRLAGVLRVA